MTSHLTGTDPTRVPEWQQARALLAERAAERERQQRARTADAVVWPDPAAQQVAATEGAAAAEQAVPPTAEYLAARAEWERQQAARQAQLDAARIEEPT